MKLEQLIEKATIGTCVGGHFKITIEYRGHLYSCQSNNTLAYDRIKYEGILPDNSRKTCGYTMKQAYSVLWNECKRENLL